MYCCIQVFVAVAAKTAKCNMGGRPNGNLQGLERRVYTAGEAKVQLDPFLNVTPEQVRLGVGRRVNVVLRARKHQGVLIDCRCWSVSQADDQPNSPHCPCRRRA